MSKSKTERAYVLNVAQQFLQGRVSLNPLRDKATFEELCGKSGRDANCFYRNLSGHAELFLARMGKDKMQRILCAGLGPEHRSIFPLKQSIKTPMTDLRPEPRQLLAGNGSNVLCNLAAVALLAAAYDLCYAKYLQGGVRPL